MYIYFFSVIYSLFSIYYILINISTTSSLTLIIFKGLLIGFLGIVIYLIAKGLLKFILVKKAASRIEKLKGKKIRMLDKFISVFLFYNIVELINIISEGEQIIKLIYEIPTAIFFAVGLTAVTKLMGNYFSRRKVGYEKRIKFDTNLQRIFNLSSEALNEIRGCTVKEKNREAGSIQAEVDLNPRSFGEEIEIKLESLVNNQIAVDISSECKEESFEDFYKNYSNVKIIITYLEENI